MKGACYCFANQEDFIKTYRNHLPDEHAYLGEKTAYFLANRLNNTCGKEPTNHSAYLAVEDFKERVLSKTPISTQIVFSMAEHNNIDMIAKTLEKMGKPCDLKKH